MVMSAADAARLANRGTKLPPSNMPINTMPPLAPGTIGEFGPGGTGLPVNVNPAAPSGLPLPGVNPAAAGGLGEPPLPPGIAAFGAIAQERAAQGGQQFDDLMAGGRFDNNPLAADFVNRGLNTRGMELVGGQVAPRTGLIGSEFALEEGLDLGTDVINEGVTTGRGDITAGKGGAIDFLSQGRDLGVDALQGGKDAFDPFFQAGTGATNMRSDLLGINGPEAQAAAFAAFKESPGQDFQQQQIEKALARQAGRTGDFGGNFQKDLARFTQGLTEQNFNTRLAQLNEEAQRGFGAAQGLGNLATTEAGIQTDFGRNAALAELGSATQLADIAGAGSVNVANLIQQTKRDIAEGRLDVGKANADFIKDTISSVATLKDNQGRGLTDILGAGATAVSTILQNSGLTAAQQQQIEAALIADLTTGSASGAAGFAGTIGSAGALAELGKSEALGGTIERILTSLSTSGGGGGATVSGSEGQMVA